MKNLVLLAAAVSGTLALQTVFAADAVTHQPLNQHQGFYVEANAGPNLYFGSLVINGNTNSTSGSEGWGWNAAAGYRFTPHFGVEGGFMQNSAEYTNDENEQIEAHTNLPYVAMRFTAPIGQRTAFFGKVGGMVASVHFENNSDGSTDNTSSIFIPYTGLGFSYALNKKVDVSVQYQGAVYGIVNAGLFSAGLTYHF